MFLSKCCAFPVIYIWSNPVAKSPLGEVGTTALTFTFGLFIRDLRSCLCILPVAAEDENSFRKRVCRWMKEWNMCFP